MTTNHVITGRWMTMKCLPRWTIHACACAGALSLSAAALADMEINPRQPAAADPQPKRRWQAERGGEQPSSWAVPESDRIIDRLLANPKFVAELGLTDDTVNKLHDEMKGVQDQFIDLDAQIRKLALEQAEQMSRCLQSAEAGTNGLMKVVEEIGKQRTEQAKLAIQRLLVIRKYLTPEQIRKARELVRERMQQKERETRGEQTGAVKGERRNAAGKAAVKADAPAGPPPPKPPEGW